MHKLLLIGTLPAAAFAAISYPPLVARAEVVPCDEQGLKSCGDGCIQLDYTCCPDMAGGCPTATSYCSLGDNGEYGCCPLGEVCGGDGGATTSSSVITITESSASTITESSTITISSSIEIISTSTITSTESSVVAPSESPSVSSSDSPAPVSTPYGEPTPEYTPEYTTSTIYSTSLRTVTSCEPAVTYCPESYTSVVTDVYPISTTVCTVSKPAPTYGYTTSTIYATTIHTVTSCESTVEYCPASSTVEVTEVYAISTTVCPVTQEQPPYPTQTVDTYNTQGPYYPVVTPPTTTLYPITNGGKYPTDGSSTATQYPVTAGASDSFGTAPTILKLFGAVVVAALAAL